MQRFASLLLLAAAGILMLCAAGCKEKPEASDPAASAPAGTSAQPQSTPQGSEAVPTPAPTATSAWTGDAKDFSFRDFDGTPHKLSEYAGQPVVVNFWAAWCPPCKAELPDFQKVYHANKDKFQFISIAVDDGQDPKAYVKQNGFDWHFAMDVDGSSVYQVSAIPMTLFIDRQGNIKEKFEGMRSGEDFNLALQKILATGQGV